MPNTLTAPATRARRELHARLEPATLLGKFGEPLARGVYEVTIDGVHHFVGISAAGDIVASVRIPMTGLGSEDAERRSLAVEAWYTALGKVWIEVERLDPVAEARAAFPDFRSL